MPATISPLKFSPTELKTETSRLYQRLHKVGWSESDCRVYADLTLEINSLKKEQNAIILAHSYQTPDIMYGVADFIGDSYSLSIIAKEHPAEKIVFCSVHFMGETVKLLNPHKQVLVPAVAGCSLAESITPNDVIKLKKEHPAAPVVCYINTTAAVKAQSDICCTSANALEIIRNLPEEEIIFIPDEFMAKNLAKQTSKKIIGWHGRCIVHEQFTPEAASLIRTQYPGVKILAHIECSPQVVALSDLSGSTKNILDYVKNSNQDTFMLVTECGITDRVKAEFPQKNIVGSCALCPYMKKIQIKDILIALKNPRPDQIIDLPQDIAYRARKTLDKMIALSRKKD